MPARGPREGPRRELARAAFGEFPYASPCDCSAKHPLTSADLEEEDALVAAWGNRLRVEPA